MPQPRVSVIVLAARDASTLTACLESLCRLAHPAHETVVVVQGHKPGLLHAAHGSRAKTVFLPENQGIAAGRNAGLAQATGDIVAFIDDDATASRDWLGDIVSAFHDPAVSAAGGKVVSPHGEILFHRGKFNWFGEVRSLPDTSFDGFPYAVGTNMAYRRSALNAIGGFDDYYFYGYDETDAQLRLHRAGHKLAQLDNAIVFHAAAPHVIKADKAFHLAKTRRYFVVKNFPSKATLPTLFLAETANLAKNLKRILVRLSRGELPSPTRILQSLCGALQGYVDASMAWAARRGATPPEGAKPRARANP